MAKLCREESEVFAPAQQDFKLKACCCCQCKMKGFGIDDRANGMSRHINESAGRRYE